MVNRRRIITVMMSLVLAFGMVGCNDSDSLSAKATAETKDGFKKIENTEKSVFELGEKQTKEIKEILDKYQVKNTYNRDKVDAPVIIAKDKDDCSFEGARGYNIATAKYISVNDGGEHEYQIRYNALIDIANNSTPRYSYQIIVGYSEKEKFELENFKMFKDLVQEVQGNEYDFATLESSIKKLEKKKKSEVANDAGSFHEVIESDENIFGDKSQNIVLTFSLRE
ncbi:hypothetical protein NNC19_17680 [Clostridium sp. SHJSY1]|uniref:hypothetical protein n=1 Tax=Clostridium sp. SHJSY1 TaxID=2942483 RepID=UPI002875FEAB|nr:hypothetical protein [Clostridium sp. SHJSY1]MDS0527524.1 hypothetical protein [Clostridium sp. SHJSY1]